MAEQFAKLSDRYVRFSEREARGRSPLYEALTRAVAGDEEALAFLATLPEAKQQPNLLLACMRLLFGVSEGWPDFRNNLLANADKVRSAMLTHATQTNEPGRCAALLPVLAQLPQPLALLEVGAAAGLCLLPDRYGYDYGGHGLGPEGTDHPVFACAASPATPLPNALPGIVWRAGLDLNPLDATNPAHAAWLEALVWPEQTRRFANLRAALKIAAAEPPPIVKADLLGDAFEELCRQAPGDATLVVFHTAVLGYVADPTKRQAFAERAMGLCRYWISNEAPDVFPDAAPRGMPAETSGRFLLSVNGRAVALADPHGATLEWIAGDNRFAD